jgi:hypothetical protein
MTEQNKYSINKRQMFIAGRSGYAAIDHYEKFAFYNISLKNGDKVLWIPGVMNQHGVIIDLDLVAGSDKNPQSGFTRSVYYVSLGISGLSVIVLFVGVPLLVILLGIML